MYNSYTHFTCMTDTMLAAGHAEEVLGEASVKSAAEEANASKSLQPRRINQGKREGQNGSHVARSQGRRRVTGAKLKRHSFGPIAPCCGIYEGRRQFNEPSAAMPVLLAFSNRVNNSRTTEREPENSRRGSVHAKVATKISSKSYEEPGFTEETYEASIRRFPMAPWGKGLLVQGSRAKIIRQSRREKSRTSRNQLCEGLEGLSWKGDEKVRTCLSAELGACDCDGYRWRILMMSVLMDTGGIGEGEEERSHDLARWQWGDRRMNKKSESSIERSGLFASLSLGAIQGPSNLGNTRLPTTDVEVPFTMRAEGLRRLSKHTTRVSQLFSNSVGSMSSGD
ncbi:hypothetical protein FA13DRAFT_1712847 [Coprinellus micaceus]|uniref:Uncharacterized protein n=1 Tax=Coprinellus micaceus TaxID=71717 RepID=A0A4Y7SZC9_COPMI|nr:hypothetical protein FA13DRAFT_1712847 [Coprinellus micaceus]